MCGVQTCSIASTQSTSLETKNRPSVCTFLKRHKLFTAYYWTWPENYTHLKMPREKIIKGNISYFCLSLWVVTSLTLIYRERELVNERMSCSEHILPLRGDIQHSVDEMLLCWPVCLCLQLLMALIAPLPQPTWNWTTSYRWAENVCLLYY